MSPRSRVATVLFGLLVLALGLGCLNYTKEGAGEAHRAWAHEMGLPEPSPTIFVAGLALTTAGAGLAGFALGRRRRA